MGTIILFAACLVCVPVVRLYYWSYAPTEFRARASSTRRKQM